MCCRAHLPGPVGGAKGGRKRYFWPEEQQARSPGSAKPRTLATSQHHLAVRGPTRSSSFTVTRLLVKTTYALRVRTTWSTTSTLAFLTGTERHRVQITYFFLIQIGSRTPSEVGLVVGSRLHRKRRRCGSLELPEGSESKPWPITAKVARTAERIRPKMTEAAAHAVYALARV